MKPSLDRLRSFYLVLSKINHLIVRVTEPQVLFEQACQIAVEEGHFRMAWVGKKNDSAQKVDVVAFSGVVHDYLEKINIDLADPIRSSGPTGTAVKTGRHAVAMDILHSAAMAPWKADAARMGIRSSGAFPIFLKGTVWGVITLYSDEVGYFEADVLNLLDEMAMDLSFALEVFDREQEVRSLEEQLFQSQKLESLGTLASGIAHDFNNILAIILGQVTVLETCTPDSEGLFRGLERIRVAGQRGTTLVRQMMALARKTPPRLEALSLGSLVVETVEFLTQTFPPSIHFAVRTDPQGPTIQGDPTQLQQLLLNLCVNARDAMPDGGTLGLDALGTPSGAVLRVSDTGVGMDKATQDRIFEPFFTTKARGKGTGLGLSMVAGIVEGHGGVIRVLSHPGQGTTFECEFPSPGTGASSQ